jgi:hypothetical protein
MTEATAPATTRRSKAQEIASSTEVAGEHLRVKDGSLWCDACKTSVSAEPRHARQHCFGKQTKDARTSFYMRPEQEQLALRHHKRVVKADERARVASALKAHIAKERGRQS